MEEVMVRDVVKNESVFVGMESISQGEGTGPNHDQSSDSLVSSIQSFINKQNRSVFSNSCILCPIVEPVSLSVAMTKDSEVSTRITSSKIFVNF